MIGQSASERCPEAFGGFDGCPRVGARGLDAARVGRHQTPNRERDDQAVVAAHLFGPLHGVVGGFRPFGEIATPDVDQRAPHGDEQHVAVGAAVDTPTPQHLHVLMRLVEPARPRKHLRGSGMAAERYRHVDVGVLEIDCAQQAGFVEAVTAQSAEYQPVGERLTGQHRYTEFLGILDRGLRIAQRLFIIARVGLGERQRQQGLCQHPDVLFGVAHRVLEHRGGFLEAPAVDPDSREEIERQCTKRARPQVRDQGVDQTVGLVDVSGTEVVAGRPQPARRRATAEFDCQIDQFGGRRRCAAGSCGVGRVVESLQYLRVVARGGQGQMSGLQLGLVDHVGHCAMHPPATRRASHRRRPRGPAADARNTPGCR